MGCDNLATKSDIQSIERKIDSLNKELSGIKSKLDSTYQKANDASNAAQKASSKADTILNKLGKLDSIYQKANDAAYAATQCSNKISQAIDLIKKCCNDIGKLPNLITDIVKTLINQVFSRIDNIVSTINKTLGVLNTLFNLIGKFAGNNEQQKCDLSSLNNQLNNIVNKIDYSTKANTNYFGEQETRFKRINNEFLRLFNQIKTIDCSSSDNISIKVLTILLDIQNRIKALDLKINGIITTLAGIVASIIAGIVAVLKNFKLEINPELNVKLDSLIGKVELALKPILNVVNNIDLTIKGIELTLKGIDFSIKGIDINITGLKLQLDSLFKLVNNFKLDIDFEPVLKINNQISLKLDNLLKLVNNIKFPSIDIDFEPVLNISNRIEAKLNAQLQIINQLQITLQAVLSFLASMQIQLIASFKAELNVAIQAILSLRNYLQAQLEIIINNNREIKDAVKFQIAAPIGDCVLIEEQQVNGETVPEHKEYQIVETRTYNSIGNALQGIYNRFNSVQQDVCEIEQKQTETDCLVLLPDPKLFYDAGKFLTFSWVLENNPKVIVYQTHTQLRNPIAALQVTPDPNIDYWSIYFDNIYRIMGKQWASFWSNDSKQEPLIKGWFISEEEAIRFFNSMLSLTTSRPLETNNPRYPKVSNNTMQIQHTGEKLILKRVCYAEKDSHTDKLKKLHGWKNPNL